MAKIGQKVALRNIVEAARALNGKIDVAPENLALIEAFQKAALEAEAALREGDKRKVKLEQKIQEAAAHDKISTGGVGPEDTRATGVSGPCGDPGAGR